MFLQAASAFHELEDEIDEPSGNPEVWRTSTTDRESCARVCGPQIAKVVCQRDLIFEIACQQVVATPSVAPDAIEEASPVAGPSPNISPAATKLTQESEQIEDSDKEGAEAPPQPIARAFTTSSLPS